MSIYFYSSHIKLNNNLRDSLGKKNNYRRVSIKLALLKVTILSLLIMSLILYIEDLILYYLFMKMTNFNINDNPNI